MATTRLVVAFVAFASLIQVILADNPPCGVSEVGTLKCDTRCGTVGLCTGVGTWAAIEACVGGNVCDDADGIARCSPAPAPICRANPYPEPIDIVTCMGVGKYPSYENCYYYYDCTTVGGSASPIACPAAHVFDSCSGTCEAGLCTSQPVHCKDGEVGVDPKNNRNHYYCLGDRRHWFTCNEGHAYAVNGKSCVKTTMTNGCLCCYGKNDASAIGGGETCQYLLCRNTGTVEIRTCQQNWYFYSPAKTCYGGPCVSTRP